MRKAILPAFIAVAIAAGAAVVYAVARGLIHPQAAAAAPTAEPAAASAPAGSRQATAMPAVTAESFTADELHAVGLSQVRPGTRIIDFELQDLKGKKVKLSGLAGQVVFLNFWATWCPPCRAEMPSMERLHARLKDKGLTIIGVDLQEGRREVEDFVREYKISFPIVTDHNGSVASSYGIRSIPTTYLIGRDGTILAGRIGGQEWDDPAIAAFLEKLLGR
jgi:peroxiredoxin